MSQAAEGVRTGGRDAPSAPPAAVGPDLDVGGDTRGARGWHEPGWQGMPRELAGDPAAALEHLMGLVPERWLRRLPERATFPWRPVGSDRPLVVKRFTGDDARERWYERLRAWRAGVTPRGPARREAESLRELAAAGFPVPRPLAWFEGPRGSGASALVMEHLEHRQTLREYFTHTAPREARGRLVELARLVARLHAAGFYHRDLYLEHVVVTGERPGELALLDAGRARRERAPRERWFVKDLAALLHSAPGAQPERARLRFLAHYFDARGLDARASRPARRAFARAVARKAARLAAHAPRHVHSLPSAVHP